MTDKDLELASALNASTKSSSAPSVDRLAAAKFTPGPWHPGHLGDDTISCECPYIFDEGRYMGAIGEVYIDNGIASIADGRNDCPPRNEAIANMHLITAAPDLYEVLKAAEEELRLIRMKDTDAVYNPMLRTQIALAFAKADGLTTERRPVSQVEASNTDATTKTCR